MDDLPFFPCSRVTSKRKVIWVRKIIDLTLKSEEDEEVQEIPPVQPSQNEKKNVILIKEIIDLTRKSEEDEEVQEIPPVQLSQNEKKINFVFRRGGGDGDGVSRAKELWTEVLSTEPKASLYHNFLSKKECKHLIEIAKPHLQRSKVADGTLGGKESSSRTSYGTFLRIGSDDIVSEIEQRIANLTGVPVEYGEQLQVLRYEVGQKFDPHYDYTDGKDMDGGPRKATFLMYLSDVEEGGETVFPLAKGVLSVKPKMGDALLFWSMKPDGTRDQASYHGDNLVINGHVQSGYMSVNSRPDLR